MQTNHHHLKCRYILEWGALFYASKKTILRIFMLDYSMGDCACSFPFTIFDVSAQFRKRCFEYRSIADTILFNFNQFCITINSSFKGVTGLKAFNLNSSLFTEKVLLLVFITTVRSIIKKDSSVRYYSKALTRTKIKCSHFSWSGSRCSSYL